jgi:hypothetical protein
MSSSPDVFKEMQFYKLAEMAIRAGLLEPAERDALAVDQAGALAIRKAAGGDQAAFAEIASGAVPRLGWDARYLALCMFVVAKAIVLAKKLGARAWWTNVPGFNRPEHVL